MKDIASLLALIEIVLSKYAGIVRRIKLSSLKVDHQSVRSIWILDIYVRFKFTWYPLWKGSNAHYRECCEYNVDISSFDIGKMLSGLERKDFGDLIKMEIVTLEQCNEAQIRDYFALATMYLYYGLPSKAEYVLRRTVKLCSNQLLDLACQNPDGFGIVVEVIQVSTQVSASWIKNQIRKVRKEQNNGVDDEPELSDLCKTVTNVELLIKCVK